MISLLPMSFIRAAPIIFLPLLAISQMLSARGACVSKHSQMGYTLGNSAYDSSLAENYPACLSRCLTDKTRCKSLSYDLAAKICELSEESRWSKYWEFKKKANSIYMEMLGVEEVLNNNATIPSIITANAVSQASETTTKTIATPGTTASITLLPPKPPSAIASGTSSTPGPSSSPPPPSATASGTSRTPSLAPPPSSSAAPPPPSVTASGTSSTPSSPPPSSSSAAPPPPSATASGTTTSTPSSSTLPPTSVTASEITTSTSSSSPPLSVLVSGTTQLPIASSSVAAFDATSFCIGKTKYKYYSYPGDCHKYVFCGFTAEIKTCIDPLTPNFNPEYQFCDLASRYSCP